MGFDINGTRLLVKSQALGVDFSEVAMLGRQGLHISERDLQKIFIENGVKAAAADVLAACGGYAEPLMTAMGAKRVDSIDASAYEHATIIHDMNDPIPSDMKGGYSLVIDGGTLEHVFNFPMAIRNCLEMVRPGGHFIGVTPANNFFGHGFYQFSPELYFRVFAPENGYEIIRMLFYCDSRNARVYEVADPNVVASRVLLTNALPSYLFVIARRVAEIPLFVHSTQQSDYEHYSWQDSKTSKQQGRAAIQSILRQILPPSFTRVVSLSRTHLLAMLRPIGTGKSSFFRPTDL